MGIYRARDVVRVPGLLSLTRVPLGLAFPLSLGRPGVALAILLAAGISDVLDGWYARHFGQVTPTGTALDPVTDKIFVACVAASLVARGGLSPWDVLLLGTREVGELPLVLWIAASESARKHRAAHPSANFSGKLATVLQFAAVAATILHLPHRELFMGATGGAGVMAAASYWLRELRESRERRAAEAKA